jgi:hypothetical protein
MNITVSFVTIASLLLEVFDVTLAHQEAGWGRSYRP